MDHKRGSFSGKIGFVLSAAGASVGLGNIWRFPYLAAKYGGAIFLLVYIILAMTFGYTMIIAETSIGRMTGKSPVGAYKSFSDKPALRVGGWINAIIPILIVPYYSVIGGWVIKYLAEYLMGKAHLVAEDGYFSSFISNGVSSELCFLVFTAMTLAIIFAGVENGIERVSKIMMPILVVLSLIIAVYSVTRPGALEGVKYFLVPNLDNFSWMTVVSAMGQMFYSLSIAMGILITSGPAIEKAGDLAALLTNLSEGDILFVDEIHRLNRSVEEILYPAMEDYAIDIIVGKGPSANSIRLDLPHFTLIGATTRAGQLSAPLRDRFGVTLRLELYTPQELSKIVTRSASILNVDIDPTGALEIARRSRGTPRIANRMLRRVRDFADVRADGVITKEVADEALRALEIDDLGLDPIDHRMMHAIIENYGGGPVGIETLAATIGEEAVTLLDVYEPYLMQLGFLQRTPRGRCVTRKAYEHLGLSMPKSMDEVPEQLSL